MSGQVQECQRQVKRAKFEKDQRRRMSCSAVVAVRELIAAQMELWFRQRQAEVDYEHYDAANNIENCN
jgi:hypothetical protein